MLKTFFAKITNFRYDWRTLSKMWSVRLQALAVLLQSLAVAAPDTAITAWNAMPVEITSMLPETVVNWVPTALMLLSMYARNIQQTKLARGGQNGQ